ncbi:helix-turn-helix transcriptional regulator [Bradyrhizobium sp. HKCCYLS2038]|uniref:helix-turn-helix transcriptional regulator n=1 Tax=Bradyrhizobium sp. HKCCYLS2038 TaxID=3420764 RepID=UPI003EC0F4E9
MSDHFLNQKQLARRWGLSPRTLERWRWLRQGPVYFKLGGRVSYRVADIEEFEGANVRKTNSAQFQQARAA